MLKGNLIKLETQGMSKREKILLMMLLVLGGGYLLWVFLLSPFLDNFMELREDVEHARAEVDSLEDRLERKPLVEEQLQELEEKQEELEVFLPSVDHLPEVLFNLENLLQDHPEEVEFLQAVNVREEEGRGEVPLEFRVLGSQEDIMSFLEGLEEFSHMAEVQELYWHNGDEINLELQLTMVLMEVESEEDMPSQEEIEEDIDVRPDPDEDENEENDEEDDEEENEN